MKQTPFLLLVLTTIGAAIGGCNSEQPPSSSTQSGANQAMAHQDSATTPSQQLHELMMRPMQNMKMSGNVDKDFATMMAEHHEQAIEMTKIEIATGSSEVLKKMAQMMRDAQTSERGMLLQIAGELKDAGKPSTASNDMHMVMMQPMDNMSVSGNVDKDFATLMAGHHEMAVKMAAIELKSGTHERLRSMAKKMKEDQTSEREHLLQIAEKIQG